VLGVAVTDALISSAALVPADGPHPYRHGPAAEGVFARLGVDVADAGGGRRPLLRFCVDWTEQRHHLAGSLGSSVLTALEHNGWVRREPGRRSLHVTEAGRVGLKRALSIAV
jgi:hypothetical protein